MNGAALKKWRESVGLSQSGLSGWLGVTANTVARWERDEISIPSFLPLALVEVERLAGKEVRKNPLQEYLLRVQQEAQLTGKDIADRARKLGHQISINYVMSIAQGRVTNPSIQTLQALAAGIGRPDSELFALFTKQAKPSTNSKPKKKGKK